MIFKNTNFNETNETVLKSIKLTLKKAQLSKKEWSGELLPLTL